jgi:hypothetical protein
VPDPSGPRKRRTREHTIAAQSQNYVERFIVRSGFTCQVVSQDYGYDLLMFTYDSDGYVETGVVFIQLKAKAKAVVTPRGIAMRMDIRDYQYWVDEPLPVFLIVYDVSGDRGYWLYVQEYFQTDPARRPRPGAKTVRVYVPQQNEVGFSFVQYARSRKANVLRQMRERMDHHA